MFLDGGTEANITKAIDDRKYMSEDRDGGFGL